MMILQSMWKRIMAVGDKGFSIRLVMCVLGLLALASVEADENQFPGKALFQRMVGEWTSEGKLTSPVSGDVIEVTESWVGKFVNDGKSFEIEGDRIWGDESQTFKWEYSYNATTESLQVLYTSSSLDEELTMEVSVNEAEGVVSLLAPMGGEGAEIQIVNKFVKNKLVSEVTLKGNDGQTALEGALTHSQKNTKDRKSK